MGTLESNFLFAKRWNRLTDCKTVCCANVYVMFLGLCVCFHHAGQSSFAGEQVRSGVGLTAQGKDYARSILRPQVGKTERMIAVRVKRGESGQGGSEWRDRKRGER